jgi:signal transduction histidine kinase
MDRKRFYLASLVASLILLIILVGVTVCAPPDAADLLLAALFSVLLVFTTTFGVPLGGGWTSLLPMTTVAAYLALGLAPAAWTAAIGALAHSWVRYRFAPQLGMKRRRNRLERASLAATNAAIQAASILSGGAVFQALGGVTPLTEAGWSDVIPLALLGLTHLGVNFGLAGLHIGARGRAPLGHYLRALPHLVLYEGAPLVFAPLMTLTYTRLGLVQFVLFSLALIVSSLTTHSLARSRERLERRVKELHGLQAVGQALSASLDINVILPAIYAQVAGLLSVRDFYVALYDPYSDTVSFPLAIEDDQPAHWSPRQAGNGLTEYILRTHRPLLIQRDFEATLKELGVELHGRPSASWLGVPLLAGARPFGVIAVQTYLAPEAFDLSHQEIMVTIASQAAIAIQNAHLYARTDKALARRAQELDSIFRTTQEGILLLDLDWRVLAINRALADMIKVVPEELSGQALHAPYPDGAPALIARIGYTVADLQADCQTLNQGENALIKQSLVLPAPWECPVERTLTPVRERGGAIAGWLLVLRDQTEERALERLREDMTHMLVHDLRSPMTVLKSAVDMIQTSVEQQDTQTLDRLITLAQQSSDRILRMVGNLLEISKFESGQMPLRPETVDTRALLQEIVARFAPLTTEAQITLETSTAPDLPPLHADPEIIDRVFTNLLDNAIKFTPDGGHIHLQAHLDASGDIHVSLSDTGPGIALEEQEHLFTKFRTLTRDGRRRGTGLGLPFCKLAVEAHGGRIGVQSQPGQGSTFWVRLPVIEAE